MAAVPNHVLSWFRAVFAECNARITEKLTLNPNIPEEALDITWIEFLQHYSTPTAVDSRWVVSIDTHYLGGLRHFYSWEIADIGLLLFIRRQGVLQTQKVALLQSKRLYPTNWRVSEETRIDYQVGLARLADPELLGRSIGLAADFEFDLECRYGALIAGSDQVKAIGEYQKASKIPVYYQFYNPWDLPYVQRVPIPDRTPPQSQLQFGARVAPAPAIHRVLRRESPGYRPTIADISSLAASIPAYGWRLEDFIVDEFLGCREGREFSSIGEARIQNLFYRRSGPIAAAVSITVEELETAG